MPVIAPISRAAVFDGPGKPLRIETFPLRSPAGSEAIARILCTTICGSDRHTYYGRRHAPAPSVLGHEMVGEICAIGPQGVSDFQGSALSLGDRITWSMLWSCGACFYCVRGLRSSCERLMKFGHEKLAPGRDLVGGFAEHCLLREGTAIFRVPDALPNAVASPANCATATVAAVFRHAGEVEDNHVVIIGAGMLGLTACAMAASRRARSVIAIEPDPDRAALARRFGATVILDGRSPITGLQAQVREATAGRGADVVMEFSGMPEAIESGVQYLRFGGRFVMAGSTFPARPAQLHGEQIVKRMLQLIGVYNYQPEDLGCALHFLEDTFQRFPFESLVGRTFTLDEAEAAMAFAEATASPRIAILPSQK